MYIEIVKSFNKDSVLTTALSAFKSYAKKNIFEGYKITSHGLEEVDGEYFLTVYGKQICCYGENCSCNTIERKWMFNLKDLGVTPETLYDFFIYRFKPSFELKKGDAIRLVKDADPSDPSYHFAYNACIINASPLDIHFITVTSFGSINRHVTAREAYHKNVKIYKYKSPDDYENYDNQDVERIAVVREPSTCRGVHYTHKQE